MKPALALSAVLAAALFTGCARKANPAVEAASKPAPAPEVKVAAAESRQIEKAMFVTGSLLADETVNLSLEVPGTVSAVHTDFGQSVRKGQVLVELDRRELTLQLERSRAALSQALARIGLSPDQEDATPDSSPAIRQAAAQLETARFKFQSAEKLVQSGDISRERFTELEKEYRAREAALEGMRDELRVQLAYIRGLRADYRLIQKRLNDATLRAPFDGAVTAKLAAPGQYVRENTPVLTIVKAGPLRLRVDVPETAVGEVRGGTALTFTTDAAPGSSFHAIVKELDPALDAKSRSLTAEARLVEPDARLKPGMFVQVRLVIARNAQVVVVPKTALYSVAGMTKLFVIRDGQAIEYKIEPGEALGDWVAVPDPIRAGDRVAVSNLGTLVHGAKVAPVS